MAKGRKSIIQYNSNVVLKQFFSETVVFWEHKKFWYILNGFLLVYFAEMKIQTSFMMYSTVIEKTSPVWF